jgi:two-component system, NtrC family, sensor histidine kinase GlrK
MSALPLGASRQAGAQPLSLLRLAAPRTMAGLVAAGCLAAALPLLAALLLAGSELSRITRAGEQTVRTGLQAVRLGAQLREDVDELERSLRQYIVLGDPGLYDVVERRLAQTRATLNRFDALDQAPLSAPVAQVRRGLDEVTRDWRQQPQPTALSSAAELGHALGAEADAVLAAGREAVDLQMDRMTRASLVARREMLVATLALVPLTILLAFSISAAVTRPLKRLGLGISELGHGYYGRPISLGFPREMSRLGARLEWLRRRLAELEADKDRFLRHVSHELKTPLASLREGTSLLHDGSLGPLAPRQREVTQILAESGAELAGLIDNLLAYARWRDGLLHAERVWFDALPLLEEVAAKQVLPLERGGLKVELAAPSRRLFGQHSQLRTALENLLTNAIKHAPTGSVIEISAELHDDRCELSVRDRGRGVPEHERQHIFEPFVRGTEAEESGIRGTGVGLSIVREIIQAHGGWAQVVDAEPGARFILSWPHPGPDADAGAGAAAGDGGLRADAIDDGRRHE